jgi:P pilus assembly chaperone PapD
MRSFTGNRAYTITITFGEQSATCRHWQTSKAASIAASRIEVEAPEDKKRLKLLVESVRKKIPFATRWRIADNFGNTAECEVA